MQTLKVTSDQLNGTFTYADFTKSHDKKLLKQAVAVKVGDNLYDLSDQITGPCEFQLICKSDNEGLEVIRHSTAHLLAQAVKQLYPSAQVTIGPVIENGFFYDFHYPDGFTEDDLRKIEQRMKKLVKRNYAVQKKIFSRNEAIKYFDGIGEHYKSRIIRDIPEDETLTAYSQDDFTDLCRGPHVPSLSMLGSFKLMSVSGAYWRGDSQNEMLQRIYGTAWASDTELETYLERIKEQEKRDHRKLAKQMDLWHTQPESPGMLFWHPNGWCMYQSLIQLMRRVYIEMGFDEVHTPMIVSTRLWEKSGHLEKFSENMFQVEGEKDTYAVKPMNCPCHVQIFNQKLHSYRELPVRLGEFGCCHRNEDSGALMGMMRTRQFVQDDGHIFCTVEQIAQEVKVFLDTAYKLYSLLGFDQVGLCLSTRPDKYVGSVDSWDQAESILEGILNDSGKEWKLQPGEGAFYGPKIELALTDCMGRVWQCGTVQLDFAMPERLSASYVDTDGVKQTPVMVHRAILGSIERFLGMMLEQHMGHLPVWMMPKQVVLMPISDDMHDRCVEINIMLRKAGARSEIDARNEKIGYKIREASLIKVPYMVIIGRDEVASGDVTYRYKGSSNTVSLEDFMSMVKKDINCPL